MTETSNVLSEIKSLLPGIGEDDSDFDNEILSCINTAMAILAQNGLKYVQVTRATKGGDISTNPLLLGLVSDYISNKVHLLFDPPQNSSLLKSLGELTDEALYRVQYQLEYFPQ